jgi:hypothetical protein
MRPYQPLANAPSYAPAANAALKFARDGTITIAGPNRARMRTSLLRLVGTATSLGWLLAATPAARGDLALHDGADSAGFDPGTLAVTFTHGSNAAVEVSVGQTNLGKVAGLEQSTNRAQWSLRDQKVTVTLELAGGRLFAHVLAEEPGQFTFPILPATGSARGWILPLFEGVYAPCGDTNWETYLPGRGEMNTTADLMLPFLGLDYGGFTLSCILTNAFNNQLVFEQTPGKQFQARLTHCFTRNHPVKEFGVVFQVGTNSPVAPARAYRDWLIEHGQFVSLREKIQKTPEAVKLLGAAHIYLWGSGLLARGNVRRWHEFARALATQGEAPTPSPAKRIWSLMSPAAKGFVTNLVRGGWADRYTTGQIVGDLNRLLAQRDLYDAAAWGGVELGEGVEPLLKADRAGLSQGEVCRLNAHLLAAAFPGLLAPPGAWGDGPSPGMIRRLEEAGFDRLWLGCEGWEAFVNRPGTVQAAKRAGFLIGPYDSYHSMHRTNEPDTWPTAQFDSALYATGAIVNADGTKHAGFKHKGFLLSPAAARPYVEERVSRLMTAFHANSWFIDCDGFGEYFDDYSEQHPATQESDMQARISRMAWIRDTFGAVIGTEGCSAGVAATVHFAHGVLTPAFGWGDPDLKNPHNKFFLGAYYPPDEPQVFFKPVAIKEEYRYIYFEPRFRLPLFETVFHDSVVATHHWSFASLKTRDYAQTVELLELLYNVPPLYHLNVGVFERRKARLLRHYKFFSPLHRELGLLPLTDFQWLTPDRSVQRTRFGDQVELTANFGAEDYADGDTKLRAGCISARWLESGKTLTYLSQPSDTPPPVR